MTDASPLLLSVHGNLPPRSALKLAKSQLDNARRTTDPELAAMLYNESKAALSRMEHPTLGDLLSSDYSQDPSLREEINLMLAELDEMLVSLRQSNTTTETRVETEAGELRYFLIVYKFILPESGERISDIPQLAYCLGVLRAWRSSPYVMLDPTARNWLHAMDKDKVEVDRIMAVATDVITSFTREGIKDIKFLEDAVRLAHVVEKPNYQYLLGQLYDRIEQSISLDSRLLLCLAHVIQGASPGYLDAADLTKILELLVRRLSDQEHSSHTYDLALSLSTVVDAIAGTSVEGVDHVQLLQSMSAYLDGLKATSDPRMVYQAAYMCQALRHTPDDESIWRVIRQLKENPIQLTGYVKAIDVKEVLRQLQDIDKGESKECSQGDGKGLLLDYLEDGGSFECKQSWYLALRIADALLQNGQFTEFKKLACEPRCYRNPAFKWGLCQLLGDLAASFEWDTNTRLNAVAFLGDVCRNDGIWGQQTDTKELNTHGVEVKLCEVRKQHLINQQDVVYVEPQAKDPSQRFNLARFRLMDSVKEFMTSARNVFLLSGSAGSGKSTFSRMLERDLWNTYERMKGFIPLHVDMGTLEQPCKDPIGDCLRRMGFMDDQIQELKDHRRFILICDDYDPTTPAENLYVSNKLNQPGGWHAKLIVCCRAEHLGSTPLNCFYPVDEDSQVHPELFQQVVIEPFNVDQVQDYIKQYVSLQRPHWTLDDYLRVFEQDPCLHNLSRNPLLLSLTLEALPRLVDSQHTLLSKKFFKVEVYDQIVAHWFEHYKARQSESDPEGKDWEKSTCGNIVRNGIDYLKRLAAAIYKNQGGDPVVEYSHLFSRLKSDEAWKEELFGEGGLNQVLLEASPLKRCGHKFQFIHPSILEYGLALAVHDPQEFKTITTSKPSLTRRGSMDSVMSFESDDTDDDATTTVDNGLGLESPLTWRSFVNDHSILEFLEDRVHQEPLFKKKLLAIIELCKTEKKRRTAAANSITILVGAGVSFKGADLQGIQIPGANLSHGSFESAQLQGADLRKVILRNTRLSKADLTQAQMKGVQFGEFPFISTDDAVNCCAYSPDGKHFAVGLNSGGIDVYSTSTWERAKILVSNSRPINSVAFSTTGQLVSGSLDKMVRVWDIVTENCLKVLTGHTAGVNSVAFSPQRGQVASGSNDQSIRLWDVSSGTCKLLRGHTKAVWSVTFSPNDCQLASGGGDKTVRLWDADTGTLHSTLSGHDGAVYSVAYSPQGHLIASGGVDKTVRLWNVESGECHSILRGHLGEIRAVSFSPFAGLVASGSTDNSIRLWDVETGSCRDISSDHNKAVRTIAFSLRGDHIVSAGEDRTIRQWNVGGGRLNVNIRDESAKNVATSPGCTLVATPEGNNVRLWDLDTGKCVKVLKGHSKSIWNVAFSPSGTQVASGSDDKTARLWDVETGACLHVFSGHDKYISSIAFSQGGNQIASGSADDTIRVWDVESGKCTRILQGHSDWDGSYVEREDRVVHACLNGP
ncbi:hypothetical protein BGX31_009410 [Mortierella sp. GBA43]|nr:hypothetical protein BGX31_009410 [Mortierella sp. GBA43]